VEDLRDLAYGLAVPDPARWLILSGWTVGAIILAAVVYRRRGQDIGETI
jgi:ABC-type polysaccharide/polyol phosphate export permease